MGFKAAAKAIVRSFGYELRSTAQDISVLQSSPRVLTFEDVVCRLMYERGPKLRFLQVGANDGVTCDPLHPFIERCGWTGIMVEPQPDQAAKLKGRDGIKVVEAAIGPAQGTMTLYTVQGQGWEHGLASFDKGHILKHAHLTEGLSDRIKPIEVPVVPFSAVLDGPVDLLQIDTEGADGMMLSLFPFETHKPAVVHFEIKHMSWRERRDTLARLASYGYLLAPSGDEDMLATRHEAGLKRGAG